MKEAVKSNLITLSFDQNGTHVIQKIMTCIDEQNRLELNFILMNNLDKLLKDANGICVVNFLI